MMRNESKFKKNYTEDAKNKQRLLSMLSHVQQNIEDILLKQVAKFFHNKFLYCERKFVFFSKPYAFYQDIHKVA